MKPLNIKSLLQAKDSLKEDEFKDFLNFYGIDVREAEIKDLKALIDTLTGIGCGLRALDKFYVGYKIPQIGKEFDLLRFGENFILNIELKSSATEDKIKKQLFRNRYYLGFIGRDVYAFTYVFESKKLYSLDGGGNLKEIALENLRDCLNVQKLKNDKNPDALFDPSDYLVSPFNSTDKFLSGRFFLTHQQEEIKEKVISAIEASEQGVFISIAGSAGTGKTLLTFDIAKDFIRRGEKPLIIHCGQLNAGHLRLQEAGWCITRVKDQKNYDFDDYDLIIIDEAQRIYQNQLEGIIIKSRASKCSCIFSHDKLQTLAKWEDARDNSAKIAAIENIIEYRLSEKIRTNKEIAAFIKMLFNNKKSVSLSNDGNIEINYFNNNDDAKNYVDGLDKNAWEVLRFTPSLYNKEHHENYSEISHKTSHQVIGQEFDGVAVIIDRFFSYAENGDLVYTGGTYYASAKMLFQNITRARKKLNLVIIGNDKLLNRCLGILH